MRQAHSGSNSPMISQNVNTKQRRKVASRVHFRLILHILDKMRKIINHHIEGGMRESHPCVQDLQHPRLGKPRRGSQILDTRMGFPRPSLNVVLDSINPSVCQSVSVYPVRYTVYHVQCTCCGSIGCLHFICS